MSKSTQDTIYHGHAIVKTYDDSRRTFAVDIEGNAYKNVEASATTYISTGAGILHAIVLNTNGGAVTIYDNTAASGTPIGIIASDAPEGTFVYNLAYETGLTVVTGATVNATIVYRPETITPMSGSISPSISTSLSPSISASISPSISASISPSISKSISKSLSPSISKSISPSISKSISKSISASISSSISSSVSPSASLSPSVSPSISTSISASISPSLSKSISPSLSPS